MPSPFLKLFGQAGNLAKGQISSERSVRGASATAEGSAIVSGQLISGVSLASGTSKSVSHRLGRTAQGAIVVLADASGTFPRYEITSPTSSSITVESDQAVTVSLWVF